MNRPSESTGNDHIEALEKTVDLIAIDGLAGTGKSTIAKALAERLGLSHLDTGASFRMMAWVALNSNAELDSETEVLKATQNVSISYEAGKCLVNGVDVTKKIRDESVSDAASKIAVHPQLRQKLLLWQQQWVSDHGKSVVEGRDTTSVVFPDALVKVYLEADPHVRASRRNETAAANVIERDARDMSRTSAPIRKVADAVVIDTTRISISEVEDIVAGLWKSAIHSHKE
ncbi:MAG: (d)CMP kinase [Actinomycetota bacterium]|nr:MAG: (d)CMP kinase [Actinomycetota bacterium]